MLSLIQFLRAVFERKAKKCEKNVKFTPFGAMSRTPRGYLGHKFGMPGCPIVNRRYMPKFIKNLKFSKRSASEKNEFIAANKFRVLKITHFVTNSPVMILINASKKMRENKNKTLYKSNYQSPQDQITVSK